METVHIAFMEHNDIKESAKVLSLAMLNNPLHKGVFWAMMKRHACKSNECSSSSSINYPA